MKMGLRIGTANLTEELRPKYIYIYIYLGTLVLRDIARKRRFYRHFGEYW